MRFCIVFFLLFSLNIAAQQVHHVYPGDLRFYGKRKSTKNLNGLYYFYDSFNSKFPNRAYLYVNGKVSICKKFMGEKRWVLYYEERMYYNERLSVIIKEVWDSSYYNPNCPTREYRYDTAFNLLNEESRKLFKSNNKWVDSWVTKSYFKNNGINRLYSRYDTLSNSEYSLSSMNYNTYSLTEYFDSLTSCKIKEIGRSRTDWDSNEDLPYIYYINYWDTTYKSFLTCSLNPDTLIKKVTFNSSFVNKQIEYRSDTLFKINIENDTSGCGADAYFQYHTNGVLKSVSSKELVYPEADTFAINFDSLGNMEYARVVRINEKKTEEQLYKSTGLKHFLYMKAWYNKRKRVERYYTPDGVLYQKRFTEKGN